jgi:hypothetical protein
LKLLPVVIVYHLFTSWTSMFMYVMWIVI